MHFRGVRATAQRKSPVVDLDQVMPQAVSGAPYEQAGARYQRPIE
jgi:hypothetical protein